MTVVNHETGELLEPMSEADARRLTERIRIAASNYTEAKAKILALVDEAKAGAAHVALGYKSWTAYLSDVLSDEPLRLARDERRELAVRLADEGMGPQSIAPILGVSHMTVHRDLNESDRTNVRADGAPITTVRATTDRDGRERLTVTSAPPDQPASAGTKERAHQEAELINSFGSLVKRALTPKHVATLTPNARRRLIHILENALDILKETSA